MFTVFLGRAMVVGNVAKQKKLDARFKRASKPQEWRMTSSTNGTPIPLNCSCLRYQSIHLLGSDHVDQNPM